MRNLADSYRGFIFDLDGTIHLENNMIDGAVETLNYLIENNKHLLFVTNNTTNTQNEYTELLNRNGVAVSSEQILTAASNCVNFLKKGMKGKKFYAIAEETFIDAVVGADLAYTENSSEVELLIVSLDRNYSQHKFDIAKNALLNGAKFFAANIDSTCPIIEGEIRDAGILILELEKNTGKKLDKHFGKPSQTMIEVLEDKMKYEKSSYLLIGDRLETDILMGNKIGVDTALVKSGIENNFTIKFVQPKYNINSIKDILN